jgi:hypothetical protein
MVLRVFKGSNGDLGGFRGFESVLVDFEEIFWGIWGVAEAFRIES